MRNLPIFLASIALLAVPAHALKPPREESPVPRGNLEGIASSNGDADLEAAIAAAAAHPLGTLENPIRVAGPEGERAYLARLRCSDGSIPKITGTSSGGPDTYGSVADLVTLDCAAAAPGRVTLAFDIYHEEHVETRTAPGFSPRP